MSCEGRSFGIQCRLSWFLSCRKLSAVKGVLSLLSCDLLIINKYQWCVDDGSQDKVGLRWMMVRLSTQIRPSWVGFRQTISDKLTVSIVNFTLEWILFNCPRNVTKISRSWHIVTKIWSTYLSEKVRFRSNESVAPCYTDLKYLFVKCFLKRKYVLFTQWIPNLSVVLSTENHCGVAFIWWGIIIYLLLWRFLRLAY